MRLHSDLKLIYLWFRGFQGLCHLLDYLSARRGDLQRQPAPKRLGLYLVVQHADDRAQGMDNTSTFVLGGNQWPSALASAYPREPQRARCWATSGIIQVHCQGSWVILEEWNVDVCFIWELWFSFYVNKHRHRWFNITFIVEKFFYCYFFKIYTSTKQTCSFLECTYTLFINYSQFLLFTVLNSLSHCEHWFSKYWTLNMGVGSCKSLVATFCQPVNTYACICEWLCKDAQSDICVGSLTSDSWPASSTVTYAWTQLI